MQIDNIYFIILLLLFVFFSNFMMCLYAVYVFVKVLVHILFYFMLCLFFIFICFCVCNLRLFLCMNWFILFVEFAIKMQQIFIFKFMMILCCIMMINVYQTLIQNQTFNGRTRLTIYTMPKY